jgi:TldD protein
MDKSTTTRLAHAALNQMQLAHVDYGDIRLIDSDYERIATKDTVVEALESSSGRGYGIRVLYKGRWGFAANDVFTKTAVTQTVKLAVQLAKASALTSGRRATLTPVKVIKGTYTTPIKEDPFQVPIEDKLQLLLQADKAQRINKTIGISQTYYQAWKDVKHLFTTEGSEISQTLYYTGAGLEATAVTQSDVQARSYPNSFRGQFNTGGFEVVRQMDLQAHAPEMAEQAIKLLTAPQCPVGDFDIILDGNQLALQVHESCGHATEGDRALGWEASYAGTTFLTPDLLTQNFRYGSDIVNLTADATIPGGLGTFGWDDDGVPAQKVYLIKNGIFKNYQTSREVASVLQEIVPGYHQSSNGTVRADGPSRLPMIRMTNINLEAGGLNSDSGRAWKLPDLISDTKNGLFFSTNRSWSIDDKRLNFQFGTEIAWEIKNGQLGRIFKNPTYAGITPQFWQSCDAICDRDHWIVWGTPNCGKGQPSQVMKTGHGTSPARFRQVKVGVWKK